MSPKAPLLTLCKDNRLSPRAGMPVSRDKARILDFPKKSHLTPKGFFFFFLCFNPPPPTACSGSVGRCVSQ